MMKSIKGSYCCSILTYALIIMETLGLKGINEFSIMKIDLKRAPGLK
jgi:hypothetical protein